MYAAMGDAQRQGLKIVTVVSRSGLIINNIDKVDLTLADVIKLVTQDGETWFIKPAELGAFRVIKPEKVPYEG